MKIAGLVLGFLTSPINQRNHRLMAILLAVFFAMVVLYASLFHVFMEAEGQEHSWVTAFYWTMVTMTTLGFGDITFKSDAGRAFSILVLSSGTVFLLILLPFTFIQLVWVPWMNRREAERAPRRLPPGTRGHLVLTNAGPIEDAVIARAKRAGIPYVVLVADLDEALRLYDRGYHVMVGPLDDPETYRAAYVQDAALVLATRADTTNTNIVYTVQELTALVPIVATANTPASVDVLELAGADQVLRLAEQLGDALFEHILGGGGPRSRSLGEIAGLRVGEFPIPVDGRPLFADEIEAATGLSILGAWSRGSFEPNARERPLPVGATAVLAGSPTQFEAFNRLLLPSVAGPEGSVLVVGGGRVGRRVGSLLDEAGIPFRIIEKLPERVRNASQYVVGDATDIDVLRDAGLDHAGAVLITTHDDDVNVYLTISCRRLRPDVQVIARANLDRNVSTLYRAGADAVLSYASTGAAAIWDQLRPGDSVLISENLEAFRIAAPATLAGQPLGSLDAARLAGCALLGMILPSSDGTCCRDTGKRIPAGAELVLVGDAAAQARFRAAYPVPRPFWRWRR